MLKKFKVNLSFKLIAVVTVVELFIMLIFSQVSIPWLLEAFLDTLILGTAIIVLFNYLLNKPLKVMLSTISAIEKGDYDISLSIRNNDEIGILAERFNMMLVGIRNHREALLEANDYIKSIIESISDSLIVVSPEGKITITNKATLNMLYYKEEDLIGKRFVDLMEERHVTDIMNEITESALLLSKDFKILEVNDSFVRMYGLRREDAIGQYCYKVTHSIDHICEPPKDRCPVQSIGDKLEPRVELHIHLDASGTEHKVQVIVSPVRNKSGEIICYLHLARILRDDQPFVNKPAQDSKADIKILIYKLELYSGVLTARYAFRDWGKGEIKGNFSIHDAEVYYKNKSGGKIMVSLSASSIKGGSGGFLGVVCVARDIRELKRLIRKDKEAGVAKSIAKEERRRAQEISQLYNKLEKSHEDLKVMQQELIQAAKMEVVGRLASGAAHEVKNPLAIILQGVEFLKGNIQTDDDNVKLTLECIDSAIRRADNVIKNLLNFAVDPKLEVYPEHLNRIIEDTLSLLKGQLDKTNIKVIKEFDESIPLTRVDKNKIGQVFLNILLNAIQAMPQGGILRLKTKLYTEGQASFVICNIEDSGGGIPEGDLEKIFFPFFTTKRSIGGTGLGLAVVKHMLDMHAAEIIIKNKEIERGASVSIKFKVS